MPTTRAPSCSASWVLCPSCSDSPFRLESASPPGRKGGSDKPRMSGAAPWQEKVFLTIFSFAPLPSPPAICWRLPLLHCLHHRKFPPTHCLWGLAEASNPTPLLAWGTLAQPHHSVRGAAWRATGSHEPSSTPGTRPGLNHTHLQAEPRSDGALCDPFSVFPPPNHKPATAVTAPAIYLPEQGCHNSLPYVFRDMWQPYSGADLPLKREMPPPSLENNIPG